MSLPEEITLFQQVLMYVKEFMSESHLTPLIVSY